MRFYFNPCFTRLSFDKFEKQESSEQVKRMQKNNNNISKNQHGIRSSEEQKLNSVQINHETFDMDESYRPTESLTMEYRDEVNNKKRKRLFIGCTLSVLVLIIVAGVIAYVAVHVMNKQSTDDCTSDTCRVNTKKSIKDNKIVTVNPTHTTKPNNNNVDQSSSGVDVCTTERCQYTANFLKKIMNFSVNPCENFHEYACGLWGNTHPLPPSMPKLDTMGLLNLNKNRDLRDIIENELRKKSNTNGFKHKLLEFYRSCKDLGTIDKMGKEPLLKFISSFGKWSPIRSWRQAGMKVPDITDLLIRSHQYFTPSVYDDKIKSPLFKAIVKVNDINSSQHILEINLPDFPITDPSTYTTDTDESKQKISKYQLLKTNYVALLGPSGNAKKVIDDLLKFETEVANISIKSSHIRNVAQRYNLTTIKELSDFIGNEIDWLRLIRGYFADVPNVKITENTFIGVRSIDYFKALNELIQRTPSQLVKDYIIWVCVWKFGSYVSAPFREADHNFQKIMYGILERPARWAKCITDIEETMEFGLASLYVEKAITDKDKKLATEIAKNITNEFRRNLVNVEWMDVGTKAKAFEKVNSIAKNIGYPDYVKNDTYLNIMYSQYHIQAKHYLENALQMYKHKKILNMMLIDKPVDRTAYDLPPTLVEAYFDPNKNKMVFLAGILHFPFYDTKGPMALNYGALGLVVGHEVTHAFDDLGRQFDGNGEKKNWWSESSSKAFHQRSNCMMQQYSNYSVYGVPVNGQMTLGENIADNGGIKVAYLAYKEWERIHGKEKKLPGIPLTMDQLLFVSHGQVWCGVYREEYVKNSLRTDYHSPAKYRIIGPLSNLKEFSESFNCPLGSPMNPVKKCRVW